MVLRVYELIKGIENYFRPDKKVTANKKYNLT